MAKRLFGKTCIGVDESNNGFHEEGLPLVVVGSLLRDYSKEIAENEPYEKKKYGYSKRNRDVFKKRAQRFLRGHKEFCYTTLSQKELERYGLVARAMAIASVVTGIMERYSPDSNLIVVPHRLENLSRTSFIKESLEALLEGAGLKIPVAFKGGEDHIIPIRNADRTAYYLAGLKYGNPKKKWPWSVGRKVRFNHVESFLPYCEREDALQQIEIKAKK